jgi:hypothetical protein
MPSLVGKKLFAIVTVLTAGVVTNSANAMPPLRQPGDSAYCVMNLKVNEMIRSKESVQLKKLYDYVPNKGEKVDMLLSEFKAHVDSAEARAYYPLPDTFSKEEQKNLEAQESAAVKPLCDALVGKDVLISYQVSANTPKELEYIKILDQIVKNTNLSMQCKVDQHMLKDMHLKCGTWDIWG